MTSVSAAPASLTPPLPTELQVEVTGACNLRCHMCLVRYRPALDKVDGSMGIDAFRRLVDELPELGQVTLQGLGEPLLAPDLFEMIAHATGRGARVGFNCNATLLTAERARRLVDAGLSWLHFSVDGATAETYESIRDRARFEVVRRNVARMGEIMRERGATSPELSVVFVAMRRNVAELPDLVRLAAGWGVHRVWVQNLSHSFSDTDPAGDYDDIRRFTEGEALWAGDEDRARLLFDEARRVAAEAGLALRLPALPGAPDQDDDEGAAATRPVGDPGCDWPWRSAYVTHEGRVQPCCMLMGADRAVLGDLASEPFAAVWKGEPYRHFREALLGAEPPPVCRGCSQYRGVF